MQLSNTGRNKFMSLATKRHYKKHTEFIIEQEKTNEVFLILDGSANIFSNSDKGQTVIYDKVGPNELIGVISAIDGGLRSASVITCSDCCIASISGVKFNYLLETDHDFAKEINAILVLKIRNLYQRIFEFSTQVVSERLVRELIRLMTLTSQDESVLRIDPAPTHFELAARISTHREAVSREMSRLARLGVIKRDGNRLVATSRAALIGILKNPSIIRHKLNE